MDPFVASTFDNGEDRSKNHSVPDKTLTDIVVKRDMTGTPDRRQLLASVGASAAALLAGCIDDIASGNGISTTDSTDGSTDTATADESVIHPKEDGPVRRIEVAATPADSPFQHDLEFLAQPADDHPAKLRVFLTNTADSEHTIRTSSTPLPFAERTGKAKDENATLVLATEDDATFSGGCWRGIPKSLPKIDSKTVAPDETLSATFELVNHEEANTCWPAGQYRFTEQYEVDPETDLIEYGWWFAVVV